MDGASVGAVTSTRSRTSPRTTRSPPPSRIDTYTITASRRRQWLDRSARRGDASTTAANQAFTITPDAGYHVADVLVDGVLGGCGRELHLHRREPRTTRSRRPSRSTPTRSRRSAGANGSITPSGAVTVAYGANQSFTITPAAGYHVADVLVDGVSVGAVTSYTFTNVTANHTIAASFAIDTYTITAIAGANGSITPSGAVTVDLWRQPGFTITPAAGYHVADVLVDGVSVGAVTSYTFTNVTANHTIAASFAINTYTITALAGANGSITPSGRSRSTTARTRASPSRRLRLPRGGRAGGRRLGGCGRELHVHERDGEPHDRGELRDRHLHDHRVGGRQRLDHAERCGVGGATAPTRASRSRRPRATTWRTCWWTASRWARSRATRSPTSPRTTRSRRASRSTPTRSPPPPAPMARSRRAVR